MLQPATIPAPIIWSAARTKSSMKCGGHFRDGALVGVDGIDVRGVTVADSLHDKAAPPTSFDAAVNAGGLRPPAEFLEESADLCDGEFSAGHAVARLRSRMKTFIVASSGGVSDMVSFFMDSRTLR